MCGFSGYISKKKILYDEAEHLKLLRHRGPDSSGVFENSGSNFFKVIFNRLSIIDTNKRSNQPYKYKNLILSFNGEIYNFKNLKRELVSIGCVFETSSDTEVLIKSIYHFGLKRTINNAEGMWAFSLYNIDNENLILCRDRFGEKPLYYFKEKNCFFFGSEVKVFKFFLNKKLTLNEKYIQKYLFYDYRILNSDDNQIFKNLKKVPAGNIIKINKKFNIIKTNYFKIKDRQISVSEKEINKNIKKILSETVNNALNSDRKLAFTLSGGVDSTGLISIAKKKLEKNVKSFTIYSEDKRYDEFENVKKTVKKLKLNHSWIKIKKQDTFRNLKKIIKFRMLPLPTYTSYIQWLMFKEISNQNYKVIISGNGSDEIFSGYYDHYLAHLIDLKNNKILFKKNFKDWKNKIDKLIRNPNFKKINFYKNNYKKILMGQNLSKIFSKKRCSFNLIDAKPFKSLLKNRMHNELFFESVPVILNEEDLNLCIFQLKIDLHI